LYNHRPLWDIIVIAFMVGGTALCVTSLTLAWRVLGRKPRGFESLTAQRAAVLQSASPGWPVSPPE
jgi:sensor histidine kinase regulating citrate/malate metabolism